MIWFVLVVAVLAAFSLGIGVGFTVGVGLYIKHQAEEAQKAMAKMMKSPAFSEMQENVLSIFGDSASTDDRKSS